MIVKFQQAHDIFHFSLPLRILILFSTPLMGNLTETINLAAMRRTVI